LITLHQDCGVCTSRLRGISWIGVIVWGTRLDETASYPTLYAEARQIAYALDGSRQTTVTLSSPSGTPSNAVYVLKLKAKFALAELLKWFWNCTVV